MSPKLEVDPSKPLARWVVLPCASLTMPPTTMMRIASSLAAVKMFWTRVAKFTEYELMNVMRTEGEGGGGEGKEGC